MQDSAEGFDDVINANVSVAASEEDDECITMQAVRQITNANHGEIDGTCCVWQRSAQIYVQYFWLHPISFLL